VCGLGDLADGRSGSVCRTQTASRPDTIASIVTTARKLIVGQRATIDEPPTDVEHALLKCASVVLGELGIVQQLCRSGAHHPRMIAGIVDLANSFGISSPAAIGVSGALVDQLRDPDEFELARLIATARSTIDDRDLVAGAAALLAAATSYLADLMSEAPTTVHDEIHRSAAPRRRRARRVCAIRR
jgi:hypothetical protein